MYSQKARCLGEVAGGASIGLHQVFWCEFLRYCWWRDIPWLRTLLRLTIEVGKRSGGDFNRRRSLWSGWQTRWQDTVRFGIGGNKNGALAQRCLPCLDIPGTRRELRALFDPLVVCFPMNGLTDSLNIFAHQHIAQVS